MAATAERLPSASLWPSAGSKFSIQPSYERHVERTTGVTLRGALRDNCLTIQGATLIVSLNIWSFSFPSLGCRESLSNPPCNMHQTTASRRRSHTMNKKEESAGGFACVFLICFASVWLLCQGPVAGVPRSCFTGPFHMWQSPADDLLTWSQCSRPADKSPF